MRSSAITCNVWWHSVSLRRRRSRTGCCACTVTPWGARATGHFDRFHPDSSETRIACSSGSASRQASARRGSEPPAASPDFLRERDDAPSFLLFAIRLPCRRRWPAHRAALPRRAGRSVACNSTGGSGASRRRGGVRSSSSVAFVSPAFASAAPANGGSLRSRPQFHDRTSRRGCHHFVTSGGVMPIET